MSGTQPKYFTLNQVALILRRSPKTVLNLSYAHHLDRYVEPLGRPGLRRERRLFTPSQVKFLTALIRPVKHNRTARSDCPQ